MKRAFGRKNPMAVAVLTLVMSMGLAACSGAATNSGASDKAAPAADTSAKKDNTANAGAANLKPYTLTLYYPGTSQPDQKLVEEKMSEYLKGKINASIQIKPIDWGAWNDKMNLLVASGEQADIIFTASWNGHSTNVAKGAFLPLNDLLDKYGQDIKKSLDPQFLVGSKINGKNYGVPTNKEIAQTLGFVLRKDLVDKYNMDLSKVKTVADMEPLFKTIKDNEPKMIPYYMSNQENGINMINQWDYIGDGTIPGIILKDQSSTKVVSELDLPETVDRIKLMRDWFKKGFINQDAASAKVFPQDQMKAGNVFAVAQSLKPGKDAEMAIATGQKLVQVELTSPTISTAAAAGSMLAISRTSKDPERAMMFINMLHSDKMLNNMLNFGIEGIHYVKKSDTVIDAEMGSKKYNPGSAWMFGNQFLNYLQPNEDPQKWEKFKQFNNAGKPSPALGFTFNSEPVKSEVAAVVNVNNQFQAALYTGSIEPDDVLAKFKAKLKEAGLDKILAEKQKQLDEFLAANKK